MDLRTPKPKLVIVGAALLTLLVIAGVATLVWSRSEWRPSGEQITTLRSLWIGSMRPLPPDPSNRYGDDPRAVALGQRLFFDTRLSANGAVACATCHQPGKGFQDGLPLARGVGTTTRRAMPIVGTADSPWFFWDGRKDSQWAQALGPLESAVEHGGNRTQYAHLIDRFYRADYVALFGPLPDLAQLPPSAGPVVDPTARAAWEAMSPADREAVTRVYANLGKAIAAYERRLRPGPSRFDAYVQAVLTGDRAAMQSTLTPGEIAGLRLFIGPANCTRCHNGPRFTDNQFHNTGVPDAAGLPPDAGRALGAQQVRGDEFNCLSRYSDATPDECAELRFTTVRGEELVGAFKPPSLRNVSTRAPYMHAGQFATLEQVVAHYNAAPPAPSGHSELIQLHLSDREQAQLVAFLRALDGPIDAAPDLLAPPGPAGSR